MRVEQDQFPLECGIGFPRVTTKGPSKTQTRQRLEKQYKLTVASLNFNCTVLFHFKIPRLLETKPHLF